ncbi:MULTISPECIES: YceI family protein [unclassified Mycolicibacterium]|uniref:YceI family protein n=1 Tax=unclassified Mycolicibacterium TaxID=2636767 RepID=UPI00130C8AB6|nr:MULTISPECIES: YceI family protein [unclassified Mycolicibacterium]MUL82824.1 YceI family protein [Mycolicibacterium sp. CBMA 329]MUL89159.1 YceI family protein [Mycolicibacterium sp. CBMA 331]MUL97726.1 YceI family protein [Mycolicibacterium sp. CBMA 334]MUM29870.1 YceI family protein [Mycolicibacterium sp. CBMA 295]MUM38675.1 YceI family protein [Mycolicibacterium sp. CBMA 247]
MTPWTLGPDSGELLIRTGVTGSAARMGHRLTIEMRSWQAIVEWDGEAPSAVEVAVELDSLDVLRGEGGMTPLSGAEKALIRSNALKTLRAKRFPQALFRSTHIAREAGTYRIAGVLEISGHSGDQSVDVRVEADGESWRITGEARVRHSDFGIKQYSMLMGAMKVADEVSVTFAATAPRGIA